MAPASAPTTRPYPSRSSANALHHTSYHAAAPRVSQRSRHSFTLARERPDSAPREQLFRYTALRKIGNSARYSWIGVRAWASVIGSAIYLIIGACPAPGCRLRVGSPAGG